MSLHLDPAYQDLTDEERDQLADRRAEHSDHLHLEHQDAVVRSLLPVPDAVPAAWTVVA